MNQRSMVSVLCRGRHFSFLKLKTQSGFKEVIGRNSRANIACKVLPLIVGEDKLSLFSSICAGELEISQFCSIIRDNNLEDSLRVPVLSVDRPISYLMQDRFSSREVYELPGGVVELTETFQQGGLREMREELRINDDQVISYAVLSEPAPYDSGSHVELTGMIVVFIKGKVCPTEGEGIRGSKTECVLFPELPDFILKARQKRVMVEGYLCDAYPKLKYHLLT